MRVAGKERLAVEEDGHLVAEAEVEAADLVGRGVHDDAGEDSRPFDVPRKRDVLFEDDETGRLGGDLLPPAAKNVLGQDADGSLRWNERFGNLPLGDHAFRRLVLARRGLREVVRDVAGTEDDVGNRRDALALGSPRAAVGEFEPAGPGLAAQARDDELRLGDVADEDGGARSRQHDPDAEPLVPGKHRLRRESRAVVELPAADALVRGNVLNRVRKLRLVRAEIELLVLALALTP